MKDEYVLYLDESESTKSKTFAIAGIAVKKSNICLLDEGINEVKKIIWGEEYVNQTTPILHCTELEKVFAKRNSDDVKGFRDDYQELKKFSAEDIEKKYEQAYGKLSQIIKKADATVFSCIVKMQQLQDLFVLDERHNGVHLIDDKYNIALQKIIESFTHYLFVNDGYGDVVYESRNSIGENSEKSPDIKLINVYHKIQANSKGIVYTNSTAIQKKNRTIMAYSKTENIAGLQIADFVANNILKFENCKVQEQVTDFMKQIHRKSYNGGHAISEKDQRSFWGMRVLPSYLKMEKLLTENKKLKNAYENLKKDRNKLNRMVNAKEKEILSLQEENEKMKKMLNDIDTAKNS